MHNRTYIISFFNGSCDNLPKREDFTFKELRLYLSKAACRKYISKDLLEAMVCGEFVENKTRATNHLTSRSIITYDIDKYKYNLEKLISECENCLKGIKYLYYTTISSTFDKPRIRILIFPNENIASGEYRNIAQSVAKDLFTEDMLQAVDDSSYRAAQLMYLPCLETSDFTCKAYEGYELEVSRYINREIVEIKPATILSEYRNSPLSNYDDEMVWSILNQYNVEETEHDDWFKVCQALHHQYGGSEKGLEIFREWSLRDSRYTEEHIKEITPVKYRSVKAECDNPVTFRSIIQVIKDKKKLVLTGLTKKFEALNKEVFIDVKRNEKHRVTSVLPTYTNFVIMCNEYDITIKYDVIAKENLNKLQENDQNSFLATIQSAMIVNGMNENLAARYIYLMGQKNKINTFKDILDDVEWDGVDRLKAFYNTLKVETKELEEIRNLYLRKWLQQMLYLTLYDEKKDGTRKIARNLLVLQSKQSCGKSTWVKSLLPQHLSRYIGEGLSLNTNDDMSILGCIRNIFVELGELEQSFKATDINQFKAFFGRTKDVVKMKYVPWPVIYDRTTSFVGTVNEVSFLKDKTGSTRFLVLPIDSADGFHRIDMLQVYRQIRAEYGYIDFELTKEEQEKQRIINEQFQQPDVIDEQFTNVYRTEFAGEGDWENCTEILEQLGYTKRDINYTRRCDIANVLRKYQFKYDPKQRKWHVKRKT